jgi:hypothetical protein
VRHYVLIVRLANACARTPEERLQLFMLAIPEMTIAEEPIGVPSRNAVLREPRVKASSK